MGYTEQMIRPLTGGSIRWFYDGCMVLVILSMTTTPRYCVFLLIVVTVCNCSGYNGYSPFQVGNKGGYSGCMVVTSLSQTLNPSNLRVGTATMEQCREPKRQQS